MFPEFKKFFIFPKSRGKSSTSANTIENYQESPIDFLIESNHSAAEQHRMAFAKSHAIHFANWCRIHDTLFANEVCTIQQLYDKYIKEMQTLKDNNL